MLPGPCSYENMAEQRLPVISTCIEAVYKNHILVKKNTIHYENKFTKNIRPTDI